MISTHHSLSVAAMAFKSQFLSVLYVNLFLFLVLQTSPSSASTQPNLAEDEYFGYWHSMRPSKDDSGLSKLSESLNKAGYNAYNAISRFVENKLIPTVRTDYGYNDTITIFAPWDTAFWCGNNCPMTKILQQVVPLNLDRNTFKKNFSKDSTFPTFSKDFTNPSFQFSDHIKITQPLIDDAAMGTYASINNVPIIHWELYNDGRVIVHGVPCVFKAFKVELNNQTKLSQTELYVPINWGRTELNDDKKLALGRCRYSS